MACGTTIGSVIRETRLAPWANFRQRALNVAIAEIKRKPSGIKLGQGTPLCNFSASCRRFSLFQGRRAILSIFGAEGDALGAANGDYLAHGIQQESGRPGICTDESDW